LTRQKALTAMVVIFILEIDGEKLICIGEGFKIAGAI
jgi:hypothetical protein